MCVSESNRFHPWENVDNTISKHCCIWDRWVGKLDMVNHKYLNFEVTGTFVLNTPLNMFYLKRPRKYWTPQKNLYHRVSRRGNIFGGIHVCVCVSVCMSVRLFALCRPNRWTYRPKMTHRLFHGTSFGPENLPSSLKNEIFLIENALCVEHCNQKRLFYC